MINRFSPSKNTRPLYVRILLGSTLVTYLVWRTDPAQIAATMSEIRVHWLIVAIFTQIVANLIWSYRWRTLLSIFEIEVPFIRILKGVYVGLFFSSFLPTSFGGDFFRAYWILGDKNIARRSLFVVLLERLIGITCLGWIALLSITLLMITGKLTPNLYPLAVPLALICSFTVMLHPWTLSVLNTVPYGLNIRFLNNVREKVVNVVNLLSTAGVNTRRVFMASLAMQVIGIWLYACLGLSLRLPYQPWEYLVLVPLVVIVTTLPLSINGIGSREAALIVVSEALPSLVTSSQAVALGLLWMAVTLTISLIGGVLYMIGDKGGTHIVQLQEN